MSAFVFVSTLTNTCNKGIVLRDLKIRSCSSSTRVFHARLSIKPFRAVDLRHALSSSHKIFYRLIWGGGGGIKSTRIVMKHRAIMPKLRFTTKGRKKKKFCNAEHNAASQIKQNAIKTSLRLNDWLLFRSTRRSFSSISYFSFLVYKSVEILSHHWKLYYRTSINVPIEFPFNEQLILLSSLVGIILTDTRHKEKFATFTDRATVQGRKNCECTYLIWTSRHWSIHWDIRQPYDPRREPRRRPSCS